MSFSALVPVYHLIDCYRLLFHQSTTRCFYICDVVIAKSLYITFLIHKEQFAFQVH